jgi:KaiC/GvpD/RAD55 family RecA-like ATPase
VTAPPTVTGFLGIPELDAALTARLPRGWLGLLVGESGAGTHLLAKQFAHAAVAGQPVLFYTTTEPPAEAKAAFEERHWDVTSLQIADLEGEYYDGFLRRDLDIALARKDGIGMAQLLEPLATGAPRSRRLGFSTHILADVAGLDGPFRLVLDSLDFLFEASTPREVLTLARQLHHRTHELGGQAMLVVHEDSADAPSMAHLSAMSDIILTTRKRLEKGTFHHELTLTKVRNQPELTRSYAVDIGPDGFQLPT